MTDESVKVAVHPASQSCPIDKREVSPSAGNRCTVHAETGSWGMLSSAMWLDDMVVPSGSCTTSGVALGRTLIRPVALIVRKWPVQPVSAMTDMGGNVDDMVEAVEGPSGSVAVGGVSSSPIDLCCRTRLIGVVTVGMVMVLGSPRPQVLGWAAVGVAGVGGTTAAARGLGGL